MSLVRSERRPWPLDRMWPEDRVEQTFRDMFRSVFSGEGMLDRMFEGGTHMMRLEEFLDGDTAVIRTEMPGIDPEKDVDISVADGILTITAKREERTEDERGDGYRSEFHYGSFGRSIRLPEGATEDDIKATYKDGILEVRIPAPKPVEKAAAKIPVQKG